MYTNYIVNKPTAERVLDIVHSAVEIEKQFFSQALKKPLDDMNCKAMCEYIEFCADRLLRELGYENRYHTANPFIFMNAISLPGKSNFFERRVGEYSNPIAVNKDAAATTLSSGKLNLHVDF